MSRHRLVSSGTSVMIAFMLIGCEQRGPAASGKADAGASQQPTPSAAGTHQVPNTTHASEPVAAVEAPAIAAPAVVPAGAISAGVRIWPPGDTARARVIAGECLDQSKHAIEQPMESLSNDKEGEASPDWLPLPRCLVRVCATLVRAGRGAEAAPLVRRIPHALDRAEIMVQATSSAGTSGGAAAARELLSAASDELKGWMQKPYALPHDLARINGPLAVAQADIGDCDSALATFRTVKEASSKFSLRADHIPWLTFSLTRAGRLADAERLTLSCPESDYDTRSEAYEKIVMGLCAVGAGKMGEARAYLPQITRDNVRTRAETQFRYWHVVYDDAKGAAEIAAASPRSKDASGKALIALGDALSAGASGGTRGKALAYALVPEVPDDDGTYSLTYFGFGRYGDMDGPLANMPTEEIERFAQALAAAGEVDERLVDAVLRDLVRMTFDRGGSNAARRIFALVKDGSTRREDGRLRYRLGLSAPEEAAKMREENYVLSAERGDLGFLVCAARTDDKYLLIDSFWDAGVAYGSRYVVEPAAVKKLIETELRPALATRFSTRTVSTAEASLWAGLAEGALRPVANE